MSAASWRTAPLGEVAELDIDRVRVEADGSYEISGVLIAGRGLFRRETIKGAQTTYPTLHRLRAGQLVYRKLTAWEGPITVVPPEFEGTFVSSEFPTFTLNKAQILPEYLRLVCQRPGFHEEMRLRSTGTAERRNRLKPADLLEIEIELPPVPEQARILLVVGALDEGLAAYRREEEAACALLVAAREAILGDLSERRLGDLLERIEAGKSPKALDRAPQGGEQGVLKVSAIRPAEFRVAETKVIFDASIFPGHARVRAGDLLLSRANTRQLVGATCLVPTEPGELYLSDKTLRLVPHEAELDRRYAVYALAARSTREQIELGASGTSDSMKNISQAVILNLDIPVPETTEEQTVIADKLDRLAKAFHDARRLRTRLEGVREAALESLLTGEQLVRESLAA